MVPQQQGQPADRDRGTGVIGVLIVAGLFMPAHGDMGLASELPCAGGDRLRLGVVPRC